MAAVVQSSSNTAYGAAPVVITKPTGLAVGDLMIASVVAHQDGVGDTTMNTPSGWTLLASNGASGAGNALFAKIADSADVSASDFSFSNTSASFMAGSILRVTGVNLVSLKSAIHDSTGNDGTNPSFTSNITPDFNGALLVMLVHGYGSDNTGSIGTYVVNGTNPTWTESLDTSRNAGTADPIAGSAYAIQTTAAAITSFGATFSQSKATQTGSLVVFNPITDVTETPSPIVITASAVDATSVIGTANIAPDPVVITASVAAHSFAGEVAETWSDQSKSSSVWTEQSKS